MGSHSTHKLEASGWNGFPIHSFYTLSSLVYLISKTFLLSIKIQEFDYEGSIYNHDNSKAGKIYYWYLTIFRQPSSVPLFGLKKRERGIWQCHYWEHTILNEWDWLQHIKYIDNNPVKHGYVNHPEEWLYLLIIVIKNVDIIVGVIKENPIRINLSILVSMN